VLAAALVPALQALQGGVAGTDVHLSSAQRLQRAAGRMEEVLAEPLNALDAAAVAAGSPTTPSSYSDSPGTPERRLVYLSRFDGDDADGDGNPFTGTDAGIIWVRVAIEGSTVALESVTSR